jgi:hypothetical protein
VDDLTTAQLLQQQKLEDQAQGQAPLSIGMANTASAVGFSYLLSVSIYPGTSVADRSEPISPHQGSAMLVGPGAEVHAKGCLTGIGKGT